MRTSKPGIGPGKVRGTPIQVAGGLVVFAFTLYAVMQWFLDDFTQTVGNVVPL